MGDVIPGLAGAGRAPRCATAAAVVVIMSFTCSLSQPAHAADGSLLMVTRHDQTRPLKTRDLLGAPVPASCHHKAGRLVGGRLPLAHPAGGADPGFATVLRGHGSRFLIPPVLADLTHDGKSELSGVLLCSAGGVTWPELVLVYQRGPKLLGFVNLGDITPAEHSDVTSMSARHGNLRVTWTSYDGCCFHARKHSGTVHWTGSRLVMRHVK